MTDTVGQIVPDIPRFYTALAEWIACILFLLPMKKKYSIKKTGLMAGIFLLIQSVFLVGTDDVPLYLWLPCMVMAVAMMMGFLYLTCEIEVSDVAYFGMIAFALAEFMAAAEWQLVGWVWKGDLPDVWVRGVLLVLVYGGIAFSFYHLVHVHLPSDGRLAVTKKEFFSGVIIAIAVFAVSNIGFISDTGVEVGYFSYPLGFIRMLVDAGGLAILYAHLMQCSEFRVRQELEAVQSVLQNQYVQYKQSRESIDLINYKYHDLKHQIAYLRSERDSAKREAYLDRMEEEIKQYEAQNKTGNAVLDTVLTSKSLYCAKHDITFTCVADGTLLEFMDVMDICNIFGNALDNAIECELKIPDKEKRLIHVTVSKQKNFLILRFENYFEGNLKVKDGDILTTKDEKEHHGYGIKSIRYIINKYDGALTVETKENWFEMKALIPIKSNSKQE